MSSLSHMIDNFDWVYGETPMASWPVAIGACVAYFIIIYGGQYLMKNRKPFDLKYIVAAHNLFLSFGSLVYTIFMFNEFYKMVSSGGLGAVFCDADHKSQRGRYYFGLYLFYLSKYYELLDTVFLVLKKKPLIFLHVYHHPATLILCFVSLETRLAPQWLATTANAIVHTFMYYYYYLAILGQTVFWKKYITTLQILQFVADCTLNNLWLYYNFQLPEGKTCGGGWGGFCFGQAILFSYLALFIQLYREIYKNRKPTPAKKVE